MNRTRGRDRCSRRRTGQVPALILTLALLSLPACTDFGTGFQERDPGGVVATARETRLELENNTATRIHHFIIAEEILPLIDWAPFCSEENAIEAGGEHARSYERVDGYRKGCTVVVFWWHPAKANGGAAMADSIRSIHLKTP